MNRFDNLYERHRSLDKELGKLSWLGAIWWLGLVLICSLIAYLASNRNAGGDKARIAIAGLIVLVIVETVALVLLVRASMRISDEKKQCRILLKKLYVSDAADKFFTEYRFDPERGFTEKDFDPKVSVNLAFCRSDDYLEGKCPNGIRMRRADVHSGEKHESWIIYDSPKSLDETLLIRPRSMVSLQDYPEIETEDSEFNKIFRCFCNDKAEAFYVLTPRLMRALIELHKNLKRLESTSVELTFVKDKVYVVLPRSTDPFEIDFSGDTSREVETAYATIEFSYIGMIGEALGVQDDMKDRELSKAEQREQQKTERANRDHWWDSAEYGDPSGTPPEDTQKRDV